MTNQLNYDEQLFRDENIRCDDCGESLAVVGVPGLGHFCGDCWADRGAREHADELADQAYAHELEMRYNAGKL